MSVKVNRIRLNRDHRRYGAPNNNLRNMANTVNKAVDMELDPELMEDLNIPQLYARCLDSGYEDDPGYLTVEYRQILPLPPISATKTPTGPFRIQEVNKPSLGLRYRLVVWSQVHGGPVNLGIPDANGCPEEYCWVNPKRAQIWMNFYNKQFGAGLLNFRSYIKERGFNPDSLTPPPAIPAEERWKVSPYCIANKRDPRYSLVVPGRP